MAFSFLFQNLLKLAQHEEDEVKTRLAIKDGQIAAIDAEVERLRQARDAGLDAKAQDLLAGRMERVRMYPAYFLRLKNREEFHLEERERLVSQRNKIIAELSEKRRARKVLEKVRERDEENFRKLEQKNDQKRMDEFAAQTFRRQEEEEVLPNA